MAGKVRGITQAKANLDKIINDVQGRKVVRAIQSALIIGSSQAALYTPIDTSTLLNSQFRVKWFTEFGHLNRGDMLTSEQHRCHNEKKKFQRRV